MVINLASLLPFTVFISALQLMGTPSHRTHAIESLAQALNRGDEVQPGRRQRGGRRSCAPVEIQLHLEEASPLRCLLRRCLRVCRVGQQRAVLQLSSGAPQKTRLERQLFPRVAVWWVDNYWSHSSRLGLCCVEREGCTGDMRLRTPIVIADLR